MTAPVSARASARQNRNTIVIEDAPLIHVEQWPEDQFVLRIAAAKCAARATPGSFVHIRCDESIPMRRPLSIMRADAEQGWIEVLFKVIGAGLHALARKKPGDAVSILGPIGKGFRATGDRGRRVLIGGGVGIPPMIFLAEHLLKIDGGELPVAFMGSEIPFPFRVATSSVATPWLDQSIKGAMPLLEEWGICSRLASLAGFDGCYEGYVTDLATTYLDTLTDEELAKTEIFSCGPTPMLKAVAALAAARNIPCQLSLEEFMACAVGGCAGCAVEVRTPDGPAMKRVCVDGPVFAGSEVFS